MEILNLYAGIGGNRKHWDGQKHNITAIEKDKEIAQFYQDHFPQDTVKIKDAHTYLKQNHQQYDFIWSSPPCPTHSKIRNEAGVGSGQNQPVYPDMKLYQEIIFLKRLKRAERFELDYVVENVEPDYKELIPGQKTQRHLFWSNFNIPQVDVQKDNIETGTLEELQNHFGFDLSDYDINHKKKVKMLRNCVHPRIGEKILQNRSSKQQKLIQVQSE
jgi:DNA (cytosine-5)-methyltransferase 1